MGKNFPPVGLEFRSATLAQTDAAGNTASAASLGTTDNPPRQTAGALILGGAHGSLTIARSLGRRGIPVWFVTHDHPLAKYSRYTQSSGDWPGPNAENAVDWLLAFAERWQLKGWVLFPGADAELRLLSQNYDVLSKMFHVAAPTWPVAQWAHDKRLTDEHAHAVGVPTPLSLYPVDAKSVADWNCKFPVILKPTVHDVQNAFTRAKAWRADDRSEMIARYNEAAALVGSGSIVIQEMISGSGEAQFSYAGVWSNGEPIASLVARRTRQFPLDFGYTSTYVETVSRPKIIEASEKFLRPLNFSGLVEVEYKHDVRDGMDKLLDVNARVWAWAGIGEAAGLDFSYLAYRIALGEAVTPVATGHDAAWVHTTRNLVAATQERLLGRHPPVQISKAQRPLAFAALSLDDPMPGLIEMPLTLGRTLARRVRALLRISD
ncbi:MAG: carboxylate--amine ligase [Xanthobacteraceae bacterium]